MTSKNVAIREDVYRKLLEAKREGESFSRMVERLLEKRNSLLPLWGVLANSDELPEIERDVREIRKTTMATSRSKL